ncbi:MAG TPA: SDR family NAD(P)-dependent oxidoreductase [Xanthobacteraceae bacterium]|nr:SDR family NAD(P)-dependent oxidoreductase [Xanthobacteraceae bacterium]
MVKRSRQTVRTVLVTGGSRGLGLAIAETLCAAGYRVVALARKPSKQLDAAITRTKRGRRGTLHFVAFDLGKIDAIAELVRDLRRQFGPLFGLVNNAALGRDGALSLMHNSQIEQVIRVNTLSPIVLSKYVVRGMMSERAGRIVNVASIVGFTGYSGLSVYAATKASMLGFTRSLAREVGRLGITVNAVAPGFIDTDMTHGLTGTQREQVVRRSALRRLAGVNDVAAAIAYFMSDAGKNVTGTVLTIDAGATA